MFIERKDKENNLFRELQESSLKLIQEHSGNIWTDYNVHDPGITILDHLHYALFELDYVNSYPFTDYLKDESGRIDYVGYGLLPQEELFTPSIVTPSDYEQLISGAFEQVEACTVLLAEDHTYHIWVQVKEELRTPELKESLIALYHANRNLCETLGKLEFVSAVSGKEEDHRLIKSPTCKPEHREPQPQRTTPPVYTSIQNDFPDNYGINRRGKPTGITPGHEARILQLKGYLLIFDYLMDHNYRQVNRIPQLLSFADAGLQDLLPDIEMEGNAALIDQQRKSGATLQDIDWWHKQKARYLDMLDRMYGEDTEQPFHHYADNEQMEKNRKRMALIRMFPELNANRFRSFNIQNTAADNIPTIQRTLAALFDTTDTSTEKPAVNLFSRFQLKVLSDEQFFHRYTNLLVSESIGKEEKHPEPVEQKEQPFNERRFRQFSRQLNLLWHHVLFDSFLKYGNNPQCYAMVRKEQKNGYLLLFKCPGMQEWINMGFFFEKETLIIVTNDLRSFVDLLNRCGSDFYLVEHILLPCADENDWHTLSVILPSSGEQYSPPEKCESLIRERLPAHLHIRFLWLHTENMLRFVQLYTAWRKALATRDEQETIRQGRVLRDFINNSF